MLNASSSLISALAALAVVVTLVFAIGQVLRKSRWSRLPRPELPSDTSRLTIIDTLALDRARRLHVIRWQGGDLLVLTGGTADQMIGSTPRGEKA